MREKDKLDLDALERSLEDSPARRFFKVSSMGGQGIGIGMGAGGLVMTIIALGGISAAFIFQVLAAVGGAAAFSVALMAVGGYQLVQEQKRHNKLKADFDKEHSKLKKSIITAFKDYELLEEAKAQLEIEISRLNNLFNEIVNEAEKQKIREKLTDLDSDLRSVEQKRKEIIGRLKAALQIVKGDNETERLTHLFGTVYRKKGKEAILEYANSVLTLAEKETQQVGKAVEKLWGVIDQPYDDEQQKSTFQDQLAQFTKFEKQKTHRAIKKVTYALTAVGGFLTGACIAITVGSFVVGGMAALIAVGWPVLAAALIAGTALTVGSVLYYRHIEKKQQKNLHRLNLASTQVTGMANYLDTKVDKKVREQLEAISNKSSEDIKAINTLLAEYEKSFKEYQGLTLGYSKTLKSLIEELKIFKTYSPQTLHDIDNLKTEIWKNKILLEELRKKVDRIIILAGSEVRKIKLLEVIDVCLQEVELDSDLVKKVYTEVDQKLHAKQNLKLLMGLENKAEANLRVPKPKQFSNDISLQAALKQESDGEGEGALGMENNRK